MARDDFAGLRDGKKMPDVRHELLTTLKGKLIPLNVLDEFKAESRELIRQVDAQLTALDSANKDDKKRITAMSKDKTALQARLARTDSILAAIGGPLTEEEARRLILKKLYDLAGKELNRYLSAEKRGLFAVVENLWDKYAVSSRELERERTETLKTLDGFLRGLGYLDVKTS